MSQDVFDSVVSFCKKISKQVTKIDKIKAERARQNRIKAQNDPFTKKLKSDSMKKFYEKKREEEAEQEAIDEYYCQPTSCYCHLGNPPCSYCTDTNYCEECDEKTWDDECPKCGKYIAR